MRFRSGVLFVEGFVVENGPVIAFMGYIVAATTLWSGTSYVITWSHRATIISGVPRDQVSDQRTDHPEDKA